MEKVITQLEWHSAKEEPKNKSHLIAITKWNEMDYNILNIYYFVDWQKWEKKVADYEILYWAYLDYFEVVEEMQKQEENQNFNPEWIEFLNQNAIK